MRTVNILLCLSSMQVLCPLVFYNNQFLSTSLDLLFFTALNSNANNDLLFITSHCNEYQIPV